MDKENIMPQETPAELTQSKYAIDPNISEGDELLPGLEDHTLNITFSREDTHENHK